MWWLVGGLWALTGVVYAVSRFIEARRQVDSMINWALPAPEEEEEKP